MSKISMECCVCGGGAGKWAQHYNRDAGYGICAKCVAQEKATQTPETIKSLYGVEGKNFSPQWFKLYDLYFKVLAFVPNSPRSTKIVNDFISRTPGAAVLEVTAEGVVIADAADNGSKEKTCL